MWAVGLTMRAAPLVRKRQQTCDADACQLSLAVHPGWERSCAEGQAVWVWHGTSYEPMGVETASRLYVKMGVITACVSR